MKKILILGGYGNFGQRISESLAKAKIPIIIAGRDVNKAISLAKNLNAEFAVFDIHTELATQLQKLNPFIVINTCGPFQNADYSVATTCITHGVHYIDLADGRDFVCGITQLNEAAEKNQVLVISGASTVPGLSSAVLDHFQSAFSEIDSLVYGIAPGQKATRGLATTQGILSYLGKRLKPIAGNPTRYGWQDLYRQKYPEIGYRWMGNCDIPDLDLFPSHYHIQSIHFSAGMENIFLHCGIWLTSWLVRCGFPITLQNHAAFLLKLSHLFDFFGSADGGMHMIITGKDHQGLPLQKTWFIIGKRGDGPQIPCIPAIVLTKHMLTGQLNKTGAMPCVGMIKLEDYLNELADFDVKTITQ